VKDRVKDGAQVGRAWPPTRPGCRQVWGDPGPGGVVEIGVVASGAHGSRNRADEPCFARGGSISQTPSDNTVRSSKPKSPDGQASPGILLSFTDCQVRASFRVVGNALFFAKLFNFFYVQYANVGNASCLKSCNQFFNARIPVFPS